jgi:hypothetical protein
MCGPFLAFAAAGHSGALPSRPRWPVLGAYHGGRMVAYLALGLAAGALGAGIERAGAMAGVARAAAVVAGLLMVAWGLDTILAVSGRRVGRLHAPAAIQRALTRVLRRLTAFPDTGRAALTGLATALLPCSWLFAFVAAAGGTGSPARGALVMLLFWTGTLPVMVTLGVTLQRLAGPMRRAVPLVTASMVVAIGLLTMAGWLRPPTPPASTTIEQSHAGHR